MPPSVSRQWFCPHVRQRSIKPHQSNSKFSSRQHAKFHQLIRMDTAFTKFESARLLSLGYLARTCLRRKVWTVCKPQRSSECYQRQKWHDVYDQMVRKAILQWKRHLAAVRKQNGGPIQHIFCWSVDWWLLWHSGAAACNHSWFYLQQNWSYRPSKLKKIKVCKFVS